MGLNYTKAEFAEAYGRWDAEPYAVSERIDYAWKYFDQVDGVCMNFLFLDPYLKAARLEKLERSLVAMGYNLDELDRDNPYNQTGG